MIFFHPSKDGRAKMENPGLDLVLTEHRKRGREIHTMRDQKHMLDRAQNRERKLEEPTARNRQKDLLQ
jgi:hypothetical protein